MKLRICLLLLLLASALFVGGCYTVLVHPEGAVLVDEYQNRKSCSDCHQASWFYHEDPYWYGGDYYGTYYPYGWYDYYSRPWWYNDYWYYDGGHGEGSGNVETGKRHMWTAPSLTPPDNISIQPRTKVQEGAQPGSTSGSQKPTQGTQQKEEEKKPEKKRHLWDK